MRPKPVPVIERSAILGAPPGLPRSYPGRWRISGQRTSRSYRSRLRRDCAFSQDSNGHYPMRLIELGPAM